jgi:hypothetical protein
VLARTTLALALAACTGASLASAQSGPIVALPPQHVQPCVLLCPGCVEISGSVACDNFHSVYTANCEGPSMSVTQQGTGCLWSTPTVYDFTTCDRYLYIAAWSDDNNAQGLLHDLVLTSNGTETIYSDNPAWRVYPVGSDLDLCGQAPTPAQIATAVQTACSTNGWRTVTVGPRNALGAGGVGGASGYPWSPVAVNAQARWTWFNSTGGALPVPFTPGADHGEFLLFRLELNRISGFISADNYFNLFTGDDENAGANMRLTFRDVGCTWSQPTGVCFVTADRYLYVLAWSDQLVQQGLIHDLRLNGTPIYSQDPAWTVRPSAMPWPGATCVVLAPTPAQVSGIGALKSIGPANLVTSAGSLWPRLECIARAARWTWFQSGTCPGPASPFRPGCNHGEVLSFRRPIATDGCACPEAGARNEETKRPPKAVASALSRGRTDRGIGGRRGWGENTPGGLTVGRLSAATPVIGRVARGLKRGARSNSMKVLSFPEPGWPESSSARERGPVALVAAWGSRARVRRDRRSAAPTTRVELDAREVPDSGRKFTPGTQRVDRSTSVLATPLASTARAAL